MRPTSSQHRTFRRRSAQLAQVHRVTASSLYLVIMRCKLRLGTLAAGGDFSWPWEAGDGSVGAGMEGREGGKKVEGGARRRVGAAAAAAAVILLSLGAMSAG